MLNNIKKDTIKTKKRIDWIDTAKGIGIILVIFSHLGFSNEQYSIFVIFSFHMPLFFFLSGLVFSGKDKFRVFLIKRLRNIYIPFIVFMLIDYFIFISQHLDSIMPFDMVVEFFKQIIGWHMFNEPYRFNGPLWFLCALFFSEIVFYF